MEGTTPENLIHEWDRLNPGEDTDSDDIVPSQEYAAGDVYASYNIGDALRTYHHLRDLLTCPHSPKC